MPTLDIYLVEDSPVIRENLIATLEELGPMRVVGTAETEADALAWLTQAKVKVDLVVVDIFLRNGSGLGVLRGAQALPLKARRVVLSNFATADMRRHCLQLGAERVFDKSHEIDDFIDYCSSLAAEHGRSTAPS